MRSLNSFKMAGWLMEVGAGDKSRHLVFVMAKVLCSQEYVSVPCFTQATYSLLKRRLSL